MISKTSDISTLQYDYSGIGDSAERAATMAEILKALAHPLRLRIAAVLTEAPHHVNALAERLNVGQAIISQQLRILRMRGLVRFSRLDGYAVYEIAEPGLPRLFHCLESCTHVSRQSART